jgi:hypothetical protein
MAAFVHKIRVSKLDAAKRQLHTAIRLWFDDGDPVSVHALVSAAHEIIHTLFRRKGLKGLLFDNPGIPDEIRTDFAAAVVSAANQFKHARHDPDGVTEFAPAFNDYLLWICVSGLWRMGEPFAVEETAIVIRLLVERPLWVVSLLGSNLPAGDTENTRQFFEMTKHQFLEKLVLYWDDPTLQGMLAKTSAAIISAQPK